MYAHLRDLTALYADVPIKSNRFCSKLRIGVVQRHMAKSCRYYGGVADDFRQSWGTLRLAAGVVPRNHAQRVLLGTDGIVMDRAAPILCNQPRRGSMVQAAPRIIDTTRSSPATVPKGTNPALGGASLLSGGPAALAARGMGRRPSVKVIVPAKAGRVHRLPWLQMMGAAKFPYPLAEATRLRGGTAYGRLADRQVSSRAWADDDVRSYAIQAV